MEDFRCCGKRLQMADRGKESEMTKIMDLWYEDCFFVDFRL